VKKKEIIIFMSIGIFAEKNLITNIDKYQQKYDYFQKD